MALASLGGALAPGWLLAASLALYAPASGIACALAQAELVARSASGDRERALTRWTLAGAAGDLGSLALLSAVALGSLGLRAAFAIAAVVAVGQAIALRREPLSLARLADTDAPDGERGVRAGRELLRPRLLLWMLGVSLCSLLDEVVIAFGALHLHVALGAGVHARTLVLGAWMAGGFVGLFLLDRVLARVPSRVVLAGSGALGAALYLAWIGAGSVGTSAALGFLAGVACSPLYPLAMARAHAILPDRPAAVNALASMFTPLEWAVLPVAVGALAAHAGLLAAMTALALQPLVLFVLALGDAPSGRRG